MAKGTSFAAKAKGKKKKSQTLVKFIKSVKSEKTGHWRFNEQMIALEDSENLDGALQRLKDETLALDMELPNPEEKDEAVIENESSDVAIEENIEVAGDEESNETTEEVAVENSVALNEKEEKSVEEESVEKVEVADEEKGDTVVSDTSDEESEVKTDSTEKIEENSDQSEETSKEKKTDE